MWKKWLESVGWDGPTDKVKYNLKNLSYYALLYLTLSLFILVCL
jgi:hypothetical protein